MHRQLPPKKTDMTDSPNELTIENSAAVLIDHQPWVALGVESIDRGVLINNVSGRAVAAKAVGVPTVLTTVGAQGSVLVDPIFSQISEVFPEITPIDRTTTAGWSDPNLRAAVEATGHTKLVMAGLWTEVCLVHITILGFGAALVVACRRARERLALRQAFATGDGRHG
jgi:nicotinamidase-related amidase